MTTRPGLPRFAGGFKTFSVSQFNDREKGTDSRLIVYSQGSRPKVHKYLWLKYLWNELTKEEWELFYSMSETLNNEIIYNSMRAINFQGKRVTRHRLIASPLIDEKDKPTYDRYRGFMRLKVEISHETRRLPKVPKFSGYIKSASAVGSKQPRKSSFLDLMAVNEEDYNMNVVFDWFTYLTIGEH
jgi:hypothetical protein